ncbi:MAG TPA: M28 family peptidase [Longimicrobium sp.]|nr:M28 family peptidase [Longimicrobium sp.]
MRFSLPVLLPIALAIHATSVAAQDGPAGARGAATIRVEDVRAHVEYLAADSLRGRATPSPGLERAASYIADRYRAWGLRPAGDSGSFVQRYTFSSIVVRDEERRLSFRAGGRETAWEHGRDYFAFAARAQTDSAPVVFAGPALVEMPALGDVVRGRIAVFHLPGSPVAGVGALVAAGTAAMEAGAAGVIVVTDPGVTADTIGWMAEQVASGTSWPVPFAGLRHDAARELFRAAGVDLDALRAAPAGPPIMLEGIRVTAHQPARADTARAPNVIGVVPGSDPSLRDSYVVVTAHFDHVGVGRPDAHGDSIYNGADDNASGTTALLEAAEAFASLRERPARSVLFLAVSGEERGLKGSVHWVRNPTVPIASVVAGLNLDMVGRNAPDTLVIMGQEYSTLGDIVRRAAAAHPEIGFHLPSRTDPGLRWFGRSDHVAFLMAGIPVLFFTTVDHPDYHRVTDEAGRIEMEKLTRVARMLFHVAHAAANDREPPKWIGTGLEDARKDASQ